MSLGLWLPGHTLAPVRSGAEYRMPLNPGLSHVPSGTSAVDLAGPVPFDVPAVVESRLRTPLGIRRARRPLTLGASTRSNRTTSGRPEMFRYSLGSPGGSAASRTRRGCADLVVGVMRSAVEPDPRQRGEPPCPPQPPYSPCLASPLGAGLAMQDTADSMVGLAPMPGTGSAACGPLATRHSSSSTGRLSRFRDSLMSSP